MAAVNTKQVAGRRQLRFASIDEAVRDIDQLVDAERRGELRAIGNWTPGQIFNHLAAWIDYAYEGYPVKPPPFFIRWILKATLSRTLKKGLPVAVKIPGVPQGTTGMDPAETAVAAQRLKKSFARLKSNEPAKFHSPAFGEMSHANRIELNLRHAELHLSFLVY